MRYTNNILSLDFSETTGVLERLRLQDGENVLSHGVGGSALDLMIGDEGWLSATTAASFAGSSGIEEGLILEVNMGPVTVLDSYRIEGALISRQVRIENRGQQEIQLKGLRLMVLGVRIGEAKDCRFEVPASILRPRIPLGKMIQLKANWSDDQSILPGALGWQDFLGSAPDMTPGLLVIHNPVREKSLMVWYYSEIESATPKILGVDHALNLGHELSLAGWLAPGASLTGGTQYIQLVEGSWDEALEAYRKTYTRVGVEPPLYGHPPEWVSTAAIYEVHPGQYGGFRGLSEELPRIRSIGFDVLYLMPVMRFNNRSGAVWDENWRGSGSPYAIVDFEAFEPTLGSEEDFIHLVGAAHDNGMKVLMDFVAQGTALDARYLQENPEWYCRDENGELVSSHGWLDTYSLDWANPEYQAYMLTWAARFVREYGIDGYRVDAPFGKEPNWDRRIPYHASYTGLGSLRMLEQLQTSVKELKPQAALLCEAFGPVFIKSHDFQYDYHPHGMMHGFLSGKLSANELGEYLHDYWQVLPRSAKRVLFTETHDTRVGFPAYALRGSMAERALFAMLVLAGFIPMLWAGQETGMEPVYRRILTVRRESAAILRGKRTFNAIACDNERVFSILCQHGDEQVWGVVSFYPERTPLTFDFSGVQFPPGASEISLRNLLEGREWDEYGRHRWPIGETSALADELTNKLTNKLTNALTNKLTLSLVPFVPYYFDLVRT